MMADDYIVRIERLLAQHDIYRIEQRRRHCIVVAAHGGRTSPSSFRIRGVTGRPHNAPASTLLRAAVDHPECAGGTRTSATPGRRSWTSTWRHTSTTPRLPLGLQQCVASANLPAPV
jgi:hypothetical protein